MVAPREMFCETHFGCAPYPSGRPVSEPAPPSVNEDQSHIPTPDHWTGHRPEPATPAARAAQVVEGLIGDRPITVLDAGGGSQFHLPISVKKTLTAIDISREAIDRNDIADKKLLGDIETYLFG